MSESKVASIGLRAKTGRAIVVVLAGPTDSPRVIKRFELSTVDPAVPSTFQPYHAVLDLPWAEARKKVKSIARKIEQAATKALKGLVKEVESEGFKVIGVAIVGAGERNLEKIGSTHIRAHAAEGVLFRAVLEVAAQSNHLAHRRFNERNIDQIAENELRFPSTSLKTRLAEMGRAAGSPWRSDEKAAAMGAWVVLAEKK